MGQAVPGSGPNTVTSPAPCCWIGARHCRMGPHQALHMHILHAGSLTGLEIWQQGEQLLLPLPDFQICGSAWGTAQWRRS